jgi:hypothetical protein
MGKKNPVSHLEWRSRDASRLKAFYAAAFGWKFDEPMPGYAMADTSNKEVGGGFMQLSADDQVPPGFSPYITVDDLADAEAKVTAAGGRVMKSKGEVPGMGWFSVCLDPDNNGIGLWQDLPKRERKAAKKAVKKAAKKAKKEAKASKKASKKAAKKAAKPAS